MPRTKLPDRGKPTPGPWEEARTTIGTGEFSGRIGVQIMNRDGWEVARVFDPEYDGISPNIRMMIAAPELVEALSQLLGRLDHHGSIDAIREEGPIEDARNALNKARGGE